LTERKKLKEEVVDMRTVELYGYVFYKVADFIPEEKCFTFWRNYDYYDYRLVEVDKEVKPEELGLWEPFFLMKLENVKKGENSHVFFSRIEKDLYFVEYSIGGEEEGERCFILEKTRDEEEEGWEEVAFLELSNWRYFTIMDGKNAGALLRQLLTNNKYKVVLF
jgi:hypothetical protein